jgi:hypothetical protein
MYLLPYLADGLLLLDQVLVQLDRQPATAARTHSGRRLPISVVERHQRSALFHLVYSYNGPFNLTI